MLATGFYSRWGSSTPPDRWVVSAIGTVEPEVCSLSTRWQQTSRGESFYIISLFITLSSL